VSSSSRTFGSTDGEWWDNTGYSQTVTASEDPFVTFYHDVPRALAEEALSRERSESTTAYQPMAVRGVAGGANAFVFCTEDRFFPEFMRPVVSERLAITPDEIVAGLCVALSRPLELADLLLSLGGVG
jgi:hypothetical protein